jgi:hypothetical protein
MDAFPPHLESSYLTREEGRELFRLGMQSGNSDMFISVTGEYLCIVLYYFYIHSMRLHIGSRSH